MPNIQKIGVFRNEITTSMSEISRVGKESGKLQHQFYQVTLPLQTHFDVLVKYFRLRIKPRSGFGGSAFTKNFRSQGLGVLHLQASNQTVKRITITAIEQGFPFLAVPKRLNEFLNNTYTYSPNADSWCLCVLSSIHISQQSKFLHLWLRKN